MRRKFFEITAADKTQKGITINTVNRVLLLIGKLYHVERVVLGQSHQDRLKARTTYSRPVIEALWATMEGARAEQSKKSPIIGAINYATNHWRALTAYLDDGRREIDNNAAERALRCVALGRKNYMFAGSDNGGHAAAAMYSLIGSAKLNGLNPEHYLAYVLQQMGASQGDEGFDVTSLLPWHVAAVIDPSAKPVAVELGVSEAEAAELSE